jgi:hypothetical protein
MMILHYQNESHGREISHSIGRYLKYCLNVRGIESTEINVNGREKIIDDPNDIHILVFTSGLHDFTYWLTLFNNLKKDVNTQECCIHIIDLTWRHDFPITVSQGGAISILNDGYRTWLTKLTTKRLHRKTNLGVANSSLISFFKAVQHEIERPSSKYKSLEEYIKAYNWDYLEKYLLESWRQNYDGKN